MTTRDVREAAAAMGRAGRGEAKRRGDGDYYRQLRAKRREPQSLEVDGERSGYTVREGLKGWIVEEWSRESGTRSGRRMLVPYCDATPRDIKLGESINEHLTTWGQLIHEHTGRGDARVLRSGHVVK